MIFSGTGSSPDHHYRIRFCTDRDHVRHFYSGPDGHRSIRIGSVFVQIETTSGISTPGRMVIDRSESDPFLYRSRPRAAFLLRAGWSSIDPNRIRFCTDRDHVRHFYSGPDGHRSIRIGSVFVQIETTSGISTPGRMVIDRSESDPFFVHLTRFQYRCVMPDPLGLNEARSDPPPAKQIGTTSRLCIPGRMVTDQSEMDPFFTSAPVPISIRYPSKYQQC